MESQLEAYANTDIGEGSGDAANKVLELKCKALILDTIHAIDMVQNLIKKDVRSTEEWIWQKQLRFYLEKGIYGKYSLIPRNLNIKEGRYLFEYSFS